MLLAEQETTITYDREQRLVRIFTAIQTDLRRLRKAGLTPTYGNGRDGFGFEVPMDRLFWKIRKPREERQAANVGGFKPKGDSSSQTAGASTVSEK